jgi:hypothetical protein
MRDSAVLSAACGAKNRYRVPATLPLDDDAFAEALRKREGADATTLKASIAAKLEQLADETVTARSLPTWPRPAMKPRPGQVRQPPHATISSRKR